MPFRLFRFCAGVSRIPGRQLPRRRPAPSLETLEGRSVPSAMGGAVYTDLNNNGVMDPGEPGLVGSTLLLNAPDGRTLATAVTGTDGRYQFDLGPVTPDLASGFGATQKAFYNILQSDRPVGYLDGKLTADNVSPINNGCGRIRLIALQPGATNQLDHNFGELRPASLAGSVDLAASGDGTQLPAEAPVAGAVVSLVGSDDKGALVSLTQTTGPDGGYRFDGLRPGVYSLSLLPQVGSPGSSGVPGNSGGVATTGTVLGISLAPGADGAGYDFTVLPTGASVPPPAPPAIVTPNTTPPDTAFPPITLTLALDTGALWRW